MSQDQDYTHGLLNNVVEMDGELKEYLVNYVGNQLEPENDEVTVHMIIQVLAAEFPELVVSIIEENYLKGYQQGLDDALNMDA
tara:strand:- start:868 stop:1116 length:249 start_codon:yes stop_codon:yes gene_type:complete